MLPITNNKWLKFEYNFTLLVWFRAVYRMWHLYLHFCYCCEKLL